MPNLFKTIFLSLLTMLAASCGGTVAESSVKSASADLASVLKAAPPEANALQPRQMQTAVFAGGCFWGIEAVFENVKGVQSAVSGYSGGTAETANYEDVSSGTTAHAEVVKIVFDPSQVSYQQLLFIFFSVAHDPTQLNYQGPDRGPQYRSAIFYADEEQRRAAAAFIEAIDKSKALAKPVVTQLVPLNAFYPAEEYHQDYMKKNPDQPYIVINDRPKLAALKAKFPDLYVGK